MMMRSIYCPRNHLRTKFHENRRSRSEIQVTCTWIALLKVLDIYKIIQNIHYKQLSLPSVLIVYLLFYILVLITSSKWHKAPSFSVSEKWFNPDTARWTEKRDFYTSQVHQGQIGDANAERLGVFCFWSTILGSLGTEGNLLGIWFSCLFLWIRMPIEPIGETYYSPAVDCDIVDKWMYVCLAFVKEELFIYWLITKIRAKTNCLSSKFTSMIYRDIIYC